MKSAGDLKYIFCDRNQIRDYVVSFHDSTEALEWNLCISDLLYIQTYQQFMEQYGGPLRLRVSFEI